MVKNPKAKKDNAKKSVRKAKAMPRKAKKANKATAKKVKKASKSATPKKTKKTVASEQATAITAQMHSIAFKQLIAHAHQFAKSPVCYRQFPDGSAEVCKLMPDGSYGDCETYLLRPVPDPRC